MSKGSYELRTPVNAIIGFAEVLEGEHFGSLTSRQRAYVAAILNAAHQLLDVVKGDTAVAKEKCERALERLRL
jgi:signal transduction histidine kinase